MDQNQGPQFWNDGNVPVAGGEGIGIFQPQRYIDVTIGEVENLERYCAGGFAPVSPGDVLVERFEIVYKLGFGGIAIVWLCIEVETGQWRAVKINSADHSMEDCGDLKTLRLMEKKGVSRKQLEENHIGMVLETFWYESLNGRHLCTVMPLHGPRVPEWRAQVRLDQERITEICYQITSGLSFLHSKGLCHNDFRPQNVLMKLRPGSLDNFTRDQMCHLLGPPQTAEVLTMQRRVSPRAPRYVFTAARPDAFHKFVMDEVVIVDFGESFMPADHLVPLHFGIPMKYAAPEICLEKVGPSLASDVWSLGLTLLELRLNEYGDYSPYNTIRTMERFVGPIPIGYRHAARKVLGIGPPGAVDLESQIDADLNLKPLTGPVEIPLILGDEDEYNSARFSDVLEKKLGSDRYISYEEPDPTDPSGKAKRKISIPYRLPKQEVKDLADLLRQLLRYDGRTRITASQALQHRWFRKYRRREPLNYWKYALLAVASLACLVYLAWTATGRFWPGGIGYHGNSSGVTDWVEKCTVIIHISA